MLQVLQKRVQASETSGKEERALRGAQVQGSKESVGAAPGEASKPGQQGGTYPGGLHRGHVSTPLHQNKELDESVPRILEEVPQSDLTIAITLLLEPAPKH